MLQLGTAADASAFRPVPRLDMLLSFGSFPPPSTVKSFFQEAGLRLQDLLLAPKYELAGL